MTRSDCLLLVTLAASACYEKADLPARPDCELDGSCSSTSGGTESSSGDASTVSGVTTDPTTSPTSSPTSDPSGDESSSGAPAETSEAESSSTGEPLDNMYAPCNSDEECTSGTCIHGFCTQICWSQEGESPCPPAPEGSGGLTIVCGYIGYPSGYDHFCEGCFDCAQYCIASCNYDGSSTCPNGGYCVNDGCAPAPDYGYCGADDTESNDVACSDGLDNDGDGWTDCEDFDCSSTPTVTICGGENVDATCMDGLDNDDDGFVDCDDFDCAMNPGVTVCG